LPPPAEFLPTILSSSDSSPGIDGIPYSVYRLVPAESSELLHVVLKTICHKAHTLRVPNPLLVWIPKAEIGLRSDNWRPLGMPSTLLRLLAAGVYYYLAKKLVKILHPAQALLNAFRGPQGNFMDVDLHLHTVAKDNPGVLVTDFVKAFEFVNPDWIMKVLKARRAPFWLLK
jgi:hypothetical protein